MEIEGAAKSRDQLISSGTKNKSGTGWRVSSDESQRRSQPTQDRPRAPGEKFKGRSSRSRTATISEELNDGQGKRVGG